MEYSDLLKLGLAGNLKHYTITDRTVGLSTWWLLPSVAAVPAMTSAAAVPELDLIFEALHVHLVWPDRPVGLHLAQAQFLLFIWHELAGQWACAWFACSILSQSSGLAMWGPHTLSTAQQSA